MDIFSPTDIGDTRERLKRIEAAIEAVTDVGLVALDRTWHCTYANQKAASLLRTGIDKLVGQPFWLSFPLAASIAAKPEMRDIFANNTPLVYEDYSDQFQKWFVFHFYPYRDGVAVTFRDDSFRKKGEIELQKRLRQQELVAEFGVRALKTTNLDSLFEEGLTLLATTLDAEFGDLFELDGTRLILRAAQRWPEGMVGSYSIAVDSLSQTGYTLNKKAPVIINDISKETRFTVCPFLIENGVASSLSVLVGDGDPFGVLEIHSVRKRDFIKEDVIFVQAVSNILATVIERRRFEETIRHQAYHDILTGLPNRKLLNDRLTKALELARLSGAMLAVMFIDLDRFKNINDSLGHYIGDKILQEVAGRVKKCLNSTDTAARLGGDEFMVLLHRINGPEDCIDMAERIFTALNETFLIDEYELHINASIGITMFPYDGKDSHSLLRNADTALYRAKDAGRNNYQLYNKAMNLFANERFTLETQLRSGIEKKEFVVYYQPIHRIANGSVTSLEALIRWDNSHVGMMLPNDFIPLAEETGLIIPIGDQVMAMICTQLQQWQRSGYIPYRIALNLSQRQLAQAHLFDNLIALVKQANLSLEMLEIEITESMAMQNIDLNIHKLIELKELGVHISIDDFGTGHSSLNYLKRLPIDKLKIDKSFVAECTTDQDDAEIVKAIVSLAHNLKLKVVAEGVETEEQLTFLKRIGCDQVQGYLLSQPLPADDVQRFMQRKGAVAAGRRSPIEV